MSSNPKLVMTGIAVLTLSDKRIYTNVRKEDRNNFRNYYSKKTKFLGGYVERDDRNMRVNSFFLMQQKAKLKKKDVNFMTGNIYNIGFIYFLLRNIYKFKKEKMKKYYLHAIHTYTHKKHLKIAIILMSLRIIAGI